MTESAGSFNNRLEPWCEINPHEFTHDDNTTYNLETSRVLVLMMSSDDAIGGFSGTRVPAAAAGTHSADVAASNGQAPFVSCVGYLRAVAYDDHVSH